MLSKLKTQFSPIIDTPTYRLVRIVVALAYTALLTLVLIQSSARPVIGPVAPRDFNLAWEIFLTCGHLIGFSLLVLLVWSALVTVIPNNRALIAAVIFACSLGLITEFLQTLVPDRSGSFFDLACDWSMAFLVAYLIHRQTQNNT